MMIRLLNYHVPCGAEIFVGYDEREWSKRGGTLHEIFLPPHFLGEDREHAPEIAACPLCEKLLVRDEIAADLPLELSLKLAVIADRLERGEEILESADEAFRHRTGKLPVPPNGKTGEVMCNR